MTGYTAKSPLASDTVVEGEQEVVRSIGRRGHMGRMPAFAALAKATGGLYVENLSSGMTVDEAIDKAGLDFTVEALPDVQAAYTDDNGVGFVTHPDWRMNVARHSDGRVTAVGMTKGRYEIVQNRSAFAFAQTLIGDFGANVAAAGSYGKPLGSRTYLALALEPFDVNGDPHQSYVTLLNSHDGTTGLVAVLAPITLACTNQVTATFGRHAPMRISLRHTASIEGRMDEARQVLGLVTTWEANFKKAAEVLLDTPMTAPQFSSFVERALWSKPKKDASQRTQTIHENRLTELTSLFTSSATNEFGRGTRYAAYNAVTEYLDWYGPVRGSDSPEVARYTRTLDGRTEALKDRAFAALVPEAARKELAIA
jgi:phage/plasmid-like protein (TIGR03299 family)